jgi:hypothetical protein
MHRQVGEGHNEHAASGSRKSAFIAESIPLRGRRDVAVDALFFAGIGLAFD